MWLICSLASQGTSGKGVLRAVAAEARTILEAYIQEVNDTVWVSANVTEAMLDKKAARAVWNFCTRTNKSYTPEEKKATLATINGMPDQTPAKTAFSNYRNLCGNLVHAANGHNMTGYVITHRFLSQLFRRGNVAVNEHLAQDDISWMCYSDQGVYDDKLERFVNALIDGCEDDDIAFGGGFAKYVLAITRKTGLRMKVRKAMKDGKVKVLPKSK
jgi:hypothetical protein